jgi:hypothetical protein
MVCIMALFVTSKAASLMLTDFPIGPERLPPMAMTADLGVTASPLVAPTITNNGGASGVTDNDATLNGEITSTGNENPAVIVYWGPADGGTNPATWTNNHTLGIETLGLVSYSATDNFSPSTIYFYRYYCWNSAGNDWADSTSNFTTAGGAYNPPTGLILTDLGGITVTANWTKAATANNTLIRISRSAYPSSITEGEWWYLDTASSVNISGLNLDVMTLYVSAWSELSGNYSATHVTASIGGEGMAEVSVAIEGLSETVGNFNMSAVLAIAMFIPLIFFSWLAIKIKSEWGSPILAFITGGLSYMLGMNAPNIIDGKYATTSFGLTLAVVLVIYSLVCVGWAWSMMFKGRGDND